MKRFQLISVLIFLGSVIQAQTSGLPVYGLVRQNFYTAVTDPVDSTITFEVFDSAKIHLGIADPAIGNIQRIGNTSYNSAINLTGSVLNPYNNTFVFMGGAGFNIFDLNTGIMTDNIPLYNPLGESYFDNFRLNNSDSTIYGLARRSFFDPLTGFFEGSVKLAKADPLIGLVTEISPFSVGEGFSLSGSAIDPHQMIYYFAIGNRLLGLDLYNGSVYSDVTMFPGASDTYFGNFTYSCTDTTLYGLAGQLYYSVDSMFGFPTQTLDSATLKLAKVDPNTGEVTVLSPVSLPYNAYSVNAGTVIDPYTKTYYFGSGYGFVGVSMVTGLPVSVAPYTFDQGGTYFDMMRGSDNCLDALPRRPDPALSTSSDDITENTGQIKISPNPASDDIQISSSYELRQLSVMSVNGSLVYACDVNSDRTSIDITSLSKGLYLIQLLGSGGQVDYKKMVKE
ncbi:MAG: T9SS type A sorting domain-containing protein [Saprospiraceae bacterium]|nr:T9SS type A sorting domain-containing protein [Saprospiraceae bacterium]